MTDDERGEWVFTFGFGHYHDGHSMASRFVRIVGTFDEARNAMVRRYGTKWAFQYPSAERAGVDRWGLIEVATCDVCGRSIEHIGGRWAHRLPAPAAPPSGLIAEREWGTELGMFTIATATHDATPRREDQHAEQGTGDHR